MFDSLGSRASRRRAARRVFKVYVPLNQPKVTYDDTKPFARAVAELLERGEARSSRLQHEEVAPHRKVLVDWSQNDPHKTTVCVYSLRAKDHPTVSTPVRWDEVVACAQRATPLAHLRHGGYLGPDHEVRRPLRRRCWS